MEMPNSHAVEFGKADKAEELPIPEWARANFSTRASVPSISPLDMAASARMIGLGTREVLGIRTMPWQKNKVARAALRVAEARPMLYSPVGYGQRYS